MPKLDHLSVQNVWLKKGVAGVDDLIEREQVSRHSLLRALKELKEDPDVDQDEVGVLETMLSERGFLAGTGQGRPEPGDVRTYKVQEDKDGSLFIRLPVSHLEVNKGDDLPCRFFVSNISVGAPPHVKEPA